MRTSQGWNKATPRRADSVLARTKYTLIGKIHSVLPCSPVAYIEDPFSSVCTPIAPTPPRSSEPDAGRPGSVNVAIWFVLVFPSHLLRGLAEKRSYRRAQSGYQVPVQRWGDFQVAAAFVCSQTRQFSGVLPGGRQLHCLFLTENCIYNPYWYIQYSSIISITYGR